MLIKWTAILALVFSGLFNYIYAQDNYSVFFSTARNGQQLISLRSNVNYHAYCVIHDGRGYLVAEFYLNPYAQSRWYYTPYGQWTWRCK